MAGGIKVRVKVQGMSGKVGGTSAKVESRLDESSGMLLLLLLLLLLLWMSRLDESSSVV